MRGKFYRNGERAFYTIPDVYDRSLRRALGRPGARHARPAGDVVLRRLSLYQRPKGFMPEQDNRLIWGGLQADQSISFQLMKRKLAQFFEIIAQDPAVAKVVGYHSGGSYGSSLYELLKPRAQRHESAKEVVDRLQSKLDQIAGAALYFVADQEVRIGARPSNGGYQYTLFGEDAAELYDWTPKIAATLKSLPLLTDVDLNQEPGGLEANLIIDRATAMRLGLTVSQIDSTLYDAFGQRQVSVL